MVAESLVEWARHYLRARDSFERALVTLDPSPTGLVARYKKRELTVVCQPLLEPGVVPPSGQVLLVLAQSPENFERLVRAFPELAKNSDLTVACVDVDSGEKWLVKPHVHVGVADPETLRAGLKALYDTVVATV